MQRTYSVKSDLYVRIEKKVPVEVFSRVSGYYRPLNQWNPAKRQEFRDRKKLVFQ